MKFPLSLGKLEIKCFLMTALAIGFIFLGRKYNLYSEEKEYIFGKEAKTNNKLLKTFLKYFGYSLLIIGDLIIKKISFRNKRKDKINKKVILSKLYNVTKEDSKYLMTVKDILFIILISLAHLADEFLALIIKTKTHMSTIIFLVNNPASYAGDPTFFRRRMLFFKFF